MRMKEKPNMKELGSQEQNHIEQVISTMALEDIQIDDQTYKALRQIAAGEKTAEQVISEIIKEYADD